MRACGLVLVAGYSCMVVLASSARTFSFSSSSSPIVASLFLLLSAHRGSFDGQLAATSQQPRRFVVGSFRGLIPFQPRRQLLSATHSGRDGRTLSLGRPEPG